MKDYRFLGMEEMNIAMSWIVIFLSQRTLSQYFLFSFLSFVFVCVSFQKSDTTTDQILYCLSYYLVNKGYRGFLQKRHIVKVHWRGNLPLNPTGKASYSQSWELEENEEILALSVKTNLLWEAGLLIGSIFAFVCFIVWTIFPFVLPSMKTFHNSGLH